MLEILNNFAGITVLIVGDAMIDRYWWGDVTRISPEAPVPVVRLKEESLKPGGAANVAANVAGLGAAARLICAVGDDREGGMFSEILEKSGVAADDLIKLSGRRTTVKTRIIAHNQHVARLDAETIARLKAEEENEVFARFQKNINLANVVIISDYAKGLLSDNLTQRLITTANSNGKIVLADPKGNDYSRYKRAAILTPNQSETAQAARIEIRDGESLARAAAELLEKLELRALLVTQGENGMTLFERGAESLHLSATAHSVYDVTGAGDTAVAALGVALGAGADLRAAAGISNAAAGLVVQKVGTSIVGFDELKRTLARQD